jgi:CBS domain-containing protein
MTIARLLEGQTASIVTCDAAMRVGQGVATLAQKRIGAMPVMNAGKIAGIFSERDVIYGLDKQGPAFLDLTIGDAMTAPAVTVSADTEVLAALTLMTKRRVRHLPVVDGSTMIGFVSIGDLVKYRIERIEAEAEAMRAYIQAA